MKIKNLKLKIFFLVLSSIFYLLFSIPTAFAQTPNHYTSSNTAANVPVNLHNWSQNVMIEVLAAAGCQLTGIDAINRQPKCLGIDRKTGQIGFVENGGGAIGLMSHAIAFTFTKPLGTIDYASYLADNFGIARPAYAAAGDGFSALSPLMKLWIGFRDVVYMLFIVVFVIVGLAIMLRVKIDPRTVMSIENQIPKIIIGILLVTFSFAIAGLLIDLMWVTIYLIISIIAHTDPTMSSLDLSKVAVSTNPFHAMNVIGGAGGYTGGLSTFITSPAASIAGMVRGVFSDPGWRITLGLITGILGGLIAKNGIGGFFAPFGPLGQLVSATVTGIATAAISEWLTSALTGLIANIIIGIAVLWALMRLWFALLSAYVYILLDVIFAPFWIVGGVVPGSPMGFSAWLRSLVANLLAFPATIMLFMLGAIFMRSFSGVGKDVFVPPLIGNPTAGGANPIGPLIGLGIIFITPQVVSILKELVKAPQFKQGAAAGQPLAVGLGAINIPKHVQQVGMWRYYSGYLKDLPFGIGSFFGRRSGEQPER